MKVYKKLFSYADNKKVFGLFSIIFSAVSMFSFIYGFYTIYKFLDTLIILSNYDLAKSYAWKTVIIFTTGAILYLLSGLCSHILGFHLETQLRKRGIDGLAGASFRFFDLNPSGKVRKTIDDNAALTHQVVAHMIPDNSQAFFGPIFSVILGFVVSTRVGIIMLIFTIIAGIMLKLMMGGNDFMQKYQESLQNLSAESVEYVRGMQVIKIFGARVDSIKTLNKAILDYARYAYDYSISCKKAYVNYQWIFFGIIAFLAIPLVFVMNKLGDPKILAVELIMISFLSGNLFVAFMKVMWAGMYIYQANFAVDSLENLYESMRKEKTVFGNEEIFQNHDIEFKHVDFGYNDTLVLQDLSFKLEEGKSYALVGSSGSGKSTIAKLISGFYKVDSGVIEIGGKPLEQYSQNALIKAISFVFQDSKLFKKTIYENVALASDGASREDVMNALHLAGCDSILDKFPERENTVIGSKGVYLSGGEKQRIAIARALLKDSPIIIMDEASAAIDPENEHELQKAFKNLIKDKTVIMIAHRMTSIRAVDEIIVLDNGKILERGTDANLMNGDTKYKKLIDLYSSANEWRVGYEEVL